MAQINEPASSTGQRTLERIIEAAEEVFIRYGFEGARMDQIAERAGVRKANIYYYFSSKEELYRALIERILRNVIYEVRLFLEHPPERTETWAQLDAFLDLLFRLVDRYRGLIGLAFSEILHPPRSEHGGSMMLDLLGQVEELGKRMIAEGIAEGVFRDQDPAQLLLSLEGAIFHYFVLPEDRLAMHFAAPKYSPEGLAARRAHLSDMIRRLLAVEP